jgi:hypothetical protein
MDEIIIRSGTTELHYQVEPTYTHRLLDILAEIPCIVLTDMPQIELVEKCRTGDCS